MKSIEKRNTAQNPQTSKRQRRHVQLPTRRDDYHYSTIKNNDEKIIGWEDLGSTETRRASAISYTKSCAPPIRLRESTGAIYGCVENLIGCP